MKIKLLTILALLLSGLSATAKRYVLPDDCGFLLDKVARKLERKKVSRRAHQLSSLCSATSILNTNALITSGVSAPKIEINLDIDNQPNITVDLDNGSNSSSYNNNNVDSGSSVDIDSDIRGTTRNDTTTDTNVSVDSNSPGNSGNSNGNGHN